MTTQRVGLLLVVVTLVAVGGCFSLALDEPTDETGLPATGGNTTTSTDNESPASSVDPANPYGERTLVVAIDETNAERNTTPLVREALEYWEQNSEEYAGYPIEYELRPNATDPDVEIVWTESVSVCSLSYDGTYVGCAPYVTESAPETATVSIETGYLRNHTVDIVKHELGHTLGLAHGDEPAALMNATLNATPREQHVDVQLVLESDDLDREAHREQLRHTLDYYEQWSSEHMQTNVTFSLQTNRPTAFHTGDLVVRVSETSGISAGRMNRRRVPRQPAGSRLKSTR